MAPTDPQAMAAGSSFTMVEESCVSPSINTTKQTSKSETAPNASAPLPRWQCDIKIVHAEDEETEEGGYGVYTDSHNTHSVATSLRPNVSAESAPNTLSLTKFDSIDTPAEQKEPPVKMAFIEQTNTTPESPDLSSVVDEMMALENELKNNMVMKALSLGVPQSIKHQISGTDTSTQL